ncbi:hypothetical protein [Paraburkholderia sp. MM5477-R1]
MKRLHLPSGITHGLDFLIPDNWSADQALAVVERKRSIFDVYRLAA